MDDFPDFVRDLTPTTDSADPVARTRLREAFGAERRRFRREWFFVRAVAVGVVMFLVWSIAPATPTGNETPLIGLARATAQLPAPQPASGEQWYVIEHRQERMSFLDSTQDEPEDITVVVSTVAETWVDLSDDTAFSRAAVSEMYPLSPDDQEALERFQANNPDMTQPVEAESTVVYSNAHPMWSEGASAVYAELSRAVEPSDDIRMDRLQILSLAAELMQRHGVDPAKRSTLLLTIARIPGIEVERTDHLVQVRYQYVVGDVAHEVRYDFDRTDGSLVGKSITTLATPTSESILLSQSRYEARQAVGGPSES
jgi:hypothetical protein